MSRPTTNTKRSTLIAAFAAFATYFCMYAFRKPFTAGTYEMEAYWGLALKSLLVLAQLCGYMLSKFVGVRVISEMPRSRRAFWMVGLMLTAELALVGFAYLPMLFKVLMLLINGLALGLIFGLVLAYLEGRKQTELLAAGLCASFIVSSGVVKSIGRWLVEDQGLSEFSMPYVTGLMFILPMCFFVWLLQHTPQPDAVDKKLRAERTVMKRRDRMDFAMAYLPGLVALLFVYVVLTVIRTMRDDFGVEIWQALGVSEKPEVFTQSEMAVAVIATAVNALAIYVVRNMAAYALATVLMCGGFALVLASGLAQWGGMIGPFAFMVACGVGLYVPYVAFHTTIFERLLAATRRPGNLGFLMYLADSVGYLGYAIIIFWKTLDPPGAGIFSFFRTGMVVFSVVSVFALLFAWRYFNVKLAMNDRELLGGKEEAAQ